MSVVVQLDTPKNQITQLIGSKGDNMATLEIINLLFIGILGIVVGSFLNVCIIRIPKGESVVVGSSHCNLCHKKLAWYELIPIISYLFLKGKCKECKCRLSPQYPLIEALNGFLWIISYIRFGFSYETIIACLLVSNLIVLSVIDSRIREIPIQNTVFIAVLGIINVIINHHNWLDLLLGGVIVSGFLFLLVIFSGEGIMGGGDAKLMFGCGLILGLTNTLLAFFLACFIGSIIHITKMIVLKTGRELALGPYLAIGVFITLIFGDYLINFYMSLLN